MKFSLNANVFVLLQNKTFVSGFFFPPPVRSQVYLRLYTDLCKDKRLTTHTHPHNI